jgi:amino acid transporter
VTDKTSDYDISSSTILTARFGHESVKVIHLVKKNLYIVIGLIVSIALLSVMNIFGVFEYFSTGNVDRAVNAILLVILIVVLVPLVLLLLKSMNVLDRWADMFERNTIATSMKIAMNKRSREEAIFAVAQSVKQIGEPLQDYIKSKKLI